METKSNLNNEFLNQLIGNLMLTKSQLADMIQFNVSAKTIHTKSYVSKRLHKLVPHMDIKTIHELTSIHYDNWLQHWSSLGSNYSNHKLI